MCILCVSVAHDIGESVRNQIHKSHSEVSEVFIHIDPAYIKLPSDMRDQGETLKGAKDINSKIFAEDSDIKAIIDRIFSTKFTEKMAVERITSHLLQGKTFLEIEVSVPPENLIQDAMKAAEEAEKEILKAAPNVYQASLQLRLGRQIPDFQSKGESEGSP